MVDYGSNTVGLDCGTHFPLSKLSRGPYIFRFRTATSSSLAYFSCPSLPIESTLSYTLNPSSFTTWDQVVCDGQPLFYRAEDFQRSPDRFAIHRKGGKEWSFRDAARLGC
jgi:hypothetical protein